MELPLFQIDAFANKPFEGNPAAVCPLDTWLPDDVMQAVAEENNLSETAFFVPKGDRFHIRWFTPVKEVDLCGHATLAAAYVVFNFLDCCSDVIEFESKSGVLCLKRENELIVMDFPSLPPVSCDIPQEILKFFGKLPREVLKSDDYLFVFNDEKDVISLTPDIEYLKKLDLRGVIVTAESVDYDFVSRFFAPKFGISEDPVTGSAHCTLAPYWAERLKKRRLTARQVSARGGDLRCEVRGERVLISGKAVVYLKGTIII